MKRIVVGVDLTPGWSTVVQQSTTLARACGAGVEFVACVGENASGAERQVLHDDIMAAVLPYSEDLVFDVRVVVGAPHQALRQAGEGADLLVVGARGTSSGRRLLLGTVAQALLHGHGCPVLVVRDVDRELTAPAPQTLAS